MQTIVHYLFLGLDYLLAIILFGLTQAADVLPRFGETNPVIPDTPGMRMVRDMGPGWNLGSTLESFYQDDTSLHLETSWGNAVTTPEVMQTVKDAGFTCVRIPVTWGNHLIDENCTIDPAWMDRVQEVVDYAHGIGLYVILNTHNDDYYGYIPDRAHEAQTTARHTAIWAQIAERFKDYDEKLLFEAINEPKVVDHYFAWRGGTVSQRRVLNRLNAAFVRTVRDAGGSNAVRWLMLPTHAASHTPLTMKAMRLPDDNRLIVSIHAYYPWEFAHGPLELGADTYGDAEKQALETMLGRIYDHFVKKGIPVYMGEFGAMDKNNTEDRVRYTADYAAIARRYGIQCAWWDNGQTVEEEYNGQSFLLLDRRELRWVYPEIVEAITGIAV